MPPRRDNINQIEQNSTPGQVGAGVSVAGVEQARSNLIDNTRQSVKLPTIELPKFNDSLSNWLGFRDTFDSLIHKNESISDIQKFHYLKASLFETAGQVVKSLEFSAANYQVAWDTLCDRFNSTRLLIHNHIKAIFEIDKMKKESSEQIQLIFYTLIKHMRALEILNQPVHCWDAILIYIIANKLDHVTLRAWEQEKTSASDPPTLENFTNFLSSRAQFLQTLEIRSHNQPSQSFNSEKNQTKTRAFLVSDKRKACIICKEDHFIQNCPKFIELEPRARSEKIKELKICLNCLRPGHFLSDCKLRSCKKCHGRHNTLLHFERVQAPSNNAVTLYTSNNIVSNVILPTALAQVRDSNNHYRNMRTILDSCSQSNFITERLCNSLKLNKTHVNIGVEMLNGREELGIKHKCQVNLSTCHNGFNFNVDCLIVPNITGAVPNSPIDHRNIKIPSHVKLADPTFHSPGAIDLLIGGQWFWNLLCVGQILLNDSGLIMQKTKLGWVVGGPLCSPPPQAVKCFLTRQLAIDDTLQKFWELEEIGTNQAFSEEQRTCEEIFTHTLQRDANGRFIVNIPLKDNLNLLDDSKCIAERRLFNLERKFKRRPELKQSYAEFLDEYERLGHMSKLINEDPNEIAYYLPHHCVVKSESTSTKLRVVFDGSAPTSTGISLNDLQMVGPVIQNDLFDILIRFRKHVYIISADIEKMYRQILINPKQRSLQRILWRNDTNQPIQVYNLNTVTYGTASASFLSIRSVFQLAYECEENLSKISRIILNDFYVDDLLTGADSVDEAEFIAKNLRQVLNRGCFNLRKWASNNFYVIREVAEGDPSLNNINLGSDGTLKTLGLNWDTLSDTLNYVVKNEAVTRVTKRQILSEVAQIFDPLGLLGPVIIIAKILLQKLWLEKVSWDESISYQTHQEWLKYKNNLAHLKQFQIPCLAVCKGALLFELHGFADASKTAYGACVYIRSKDGEGNLQIHLLCSKSRVAPLKVQTIPRLKLCGALLLSKLMKKVKKALDRPVDSIYYWTHSSIVLSWLRLTPRSLPVFISNRVSQIQNMSDVEEWHHVPTKFNPAGYLSRGLFPMELFSHELWWKGPDFLLAESSQWPRLPSAPTTIEEMKNSITVSLHVATATNALVNYLGNHFSSINKIVRILAYVNRFILRIRRDKRLQRGYLRSQETHEALLSLIKIIQSESFSDDLRTLRTGKSIVKGRLAALAPFIDERGILRVGGRLNNSGFSMDKKHPILLDSNHKLTILIMRSEHQRLLHAGPQLLLASIRDKFWPIRGRNLARKIVKNCIKCAKADPRPAKFVMGNLPKSRVSPVPPFFNTGVDYAGPFLIKDKKGRGSKLTKCYIALFVCFVTKALHLELVSDLTKESFIAALHRFVARRGKPSQIFSDNGSTFIGAHNELNDLGQFLKKELDAVGESIENLDIKWHFIPAYFPHHGGIWEAGVKSVKFHLKRIAGDAHLLFEELYTLLAQIEAVLNSRPICPLSNDPNDLAPLTPAHFLIGRTYVAAPDASLLHLREGRLSNWQRVQALQQHFWSRWHKEYVSELQKITKWKKPYPELKRGTLVLIKDDNLPPSRWKLGRVTETHPGSDMVTRVASVRTSIGVTRRALTKLCPLPNEQSGEPS